MFAIGDKVVYPLHGAGIIEDLEEKKIDGTAQPYYVLRIPVGNLKIMVSVKNADKVGIRPVMPSTDIMDAMESVKVRPIKMNDNWNLRYKENMEKIKTGYIDESAEVFRNLRQRERERGLSSAEKKMLTTVKQIILSEIILSHDIEKPVAEEILEEAFS
ncbi:MAG: CarD family transcriptional regulator [Clostridiales bacterium]|jgi:CarD family transcriptional regulator|nr:CarD family transcriptional regulator [Clostridiales bacterium]